MEAVWRTVIVLGWELDDDQYPFYRMRFLPRPGETAVEQAAEAVSELHRVYGAGIRIRLIPSWEGSN